MLTFDSKPTHVGYFPCDFPQEVVKNEPMFFNASFHYAMKNGGPVTKAFLCALPSNYAEGVFDSRVHMLMPGWYPCIPGWHHDDVPRGTDGQPDYVNPSYRSQHICGLVNAEICPTVFAIGECEMNKVPKGEIVYKQWNNEVDTLIQNRSVTTVEAQSGQLIHFDWQTFHCGQAARKNGWRWFGRISINTDRQKTITNEIRRQVQVYLEFPMEGW